MEPPTSVLREIEDWYAQQCDGDWEHHFGIQIGNIDNPGWMVSVDLAGTTLEHTPFPQMRENYDDPLDWMICEKCGGQFVGNGGPRKLEDILQTFLAWARESPATEKT